MDDGEVQVVGRDCAMQLVMRHASMLRARFAVWIGQDAQRILFKARASPIGLHVRTLIAAPLGILERLCSSTVATTGDASRTGQHDTPTQKCPSVNEAIARDKFIGRSGA